MTRNEGNLDRIVRIVAGAALAVLFVTGVAAGVLGWILLALGAVLVLTGLTGFCPLYAVFGVQTCPIGERRG